MELDSPPPANPPEITWISPGVSGVELVLADEVMGAVPSPNFLRPRSDVDVHVGSGIRFPSLAGCNHLFGAHDPYGIHNTWLSLSLLGLSLFETATLKTFHVVSHVGPVILRLSRG